MKFMENFQSNREAVARSASTEQPHDFVIVELVHSALLKKQDSSEIHPDNFTVTDSRET
jgi:hypothetical protein